MATEPRDELWEVAFETYYDTYYQELLASRLIDRWQTFDETTKVLVALTASGSALTGWTLWTQPDLKNLWTFMAGIAAVLAIVHATLGVPGRLKDEGEIRRRFASLRTDLETFRQRMRVDSNFPVADFTREFVEFKKRYSDCVQLVRNDILLTRSFQVKVQNDLNTMLGGEIA